jgi:hypothetical protein
MPKSYRIDRLLQELGIGYLMILTFSEACPKSAIKVNVLLQVGNCETSRELWTTRVPE